LDVFRNNFRRTSLHSLHHCWLFRVPLGVPKVCWRENRTSLPRATHVTPRSVARRPANLTCWLTMENIRDWLDNRWPCRDTCTNQSADTSKSGISRLESDWSTCVWIGRLAGISRSWRQQSSRSESAWVLEADGTYIEWDNNDSS
jgi:hypothetical protein